MIEGLGVYGSASGSAAKTKSADETMGKDAFLKLLVTQLENQDPLNPTENTEFVAQLAQFSSLEGIQNLNSSLGSMKGGIEALQGFGAASLIGKNAKVQSSTFKYEGTPETLGFNLPADASAASVIVRDPSGRAVKEIELGQVKAGYHEAAWDGTNAAGLAAPAGLYTFSVEGRGVTNKPVVAKPFINGPITGVSLTGDSALIVDGVEVTRDLVSEVY